MKKAMVQNRKSWYQRAMAIAKLAKKWRTTTETTTIPKSPQQILRSSTRNQNQNQLRKCKSLKLAAPSFTRVCLCAPIGPYGDVFIRSYVPRRRSSSYTPSKPLLPVVNETVVAARMSVDSGRRVFRGKSLEENELMRRFVVAGEEAMVEYRRRDLMEIVKKRNHMRKKKKLGPSPLSRMVIAEDHED